MKALKRNTAGIGMLAVGVVALFLAVQPQAARAGDDEWATAGKILAGVVGAHILVNGLPHYGGGVTVHETRVSYAPRTYCPPPRAVVQYYPVRRVVRRPVVGHHTRGRRRCQGGCGYRTTTVRRRHGGRTDHRSASYAHAGGTYGTSSGHQRRVW